MKNIFFALLCCLSLILVSCSDDSESDPGEGQSSLDLTFQNFSATADADGKASFNFTLPSGTNAFQLAASSGSLSALSSGGRSLLDRGGMASARQNGSTVNVPYYGPPVPVAAEINAAFSASPGSSVSLRVSSKGDVTPAEGTLKLNIVLLGPAGNSEDTMEALDTAMEGARITYSRAGISLDTMVTNFDGPGVAPEPGDPLYQSLVSSQRKEAVNVVIATDRKGTKSYEYKYGTSGTVPFPVLANADSVVIISLEDITGNGIFDDSVHEDEERLLGEEIGRFTAKALGLPNLVNFKGNQVTGSDDIPDSPSCISRDSCEDDSSVRTNLMMPEPMDDDSEDEDRSSRQYYPRDQLTAQQAQVLNNTAFVD